MSPRREVSARGAAALTLAIGVVALAACSSPKSSAGETTTTDASVAPAFCNALLDQDSAPQPTPELAAALAEHVPKPLIEPVETWQREVDASRRGSAAGRRAEDFIHAWAHANCGFHQVDIEVRDDSQIRGVDEELPAGSTSFEVLSTAEKVTQEVELLRRPYDDETPILDQLDAYYRGEASGLRRVADVLVPPGRTAGFTARLVRGDYLLVNPRPDPDNHDEPKYQHGMITEFTVE